MAMPFRAFAPFDAVMPLGFDCTPHRISRQGFCCAPFALIPSGSWAKRRRCWAGQAGRPQWQRQRSSRRGSRHLLDTSFSQSLNSSNLCCLIPEPSFGSLCLCTLWCGSCCPGAGTATRQHSATANSRGQWHCLKAAASYACLNSKQGRGVFHWHISETLACWQK